MILILSNEQDISTNNVIDWINKRKQKFIRINDSSVVNIKSLVFDTKHIKIIVTIDGEEIDLSKLKSYWYRRGHLKIDFNSVVIQDKIIENVINDYLFRETIHLTDFIHLYVEAKNSIGKFPISFYENLLNKLSEYGIGHVELIIEFQPGFTDELLIKFAHKYPQIVEMLVYGANENRNIKDNHYGFHTINLSIKSYTLLQCEQRISREDFVVNISFFSESQHFNPYYNQKLAIDYLGNIKNSIFSNVSYGNVGSNTIKSIVSTNEFKELWYIKKDSIKICKDCEYRYMCPDWREPKRLTDTTFEHVTDCNYDVYTNFWVK